MDLIDRAEVQYKMLEILPEADSLEWYEQAKPDEVKDLVDELYSNVLNANQIDAQPVKHGKWVLQMDGCSLQKCSCCGYEYSDRIECDNFCGNCGADMRSGKTGKWIDHTLHHYYDYPKFICSICGKILELDKKCLPCECPKCGAKMDGGAE